MFSANSRDYDVKVELSLCFNGISTVYLAEYRPSGQHIALKKYFLEKASKDETAAIRDEILTMRQFNHPNLHNFFTAFISGNEMHLVSPLMCFGSCKDTIKNCFNTGFPEVLVALIIRDVLSGLEYLHRRGYIHRAIRASHILLNQTKAVLSGFRECACLDSHGERVHKLHHLAPMSAKSLNWLAPEVLEQNLIGYNEKSDMYSIGITCCELSNGIEPFVDAEPTFMFTEKVRGNGPTLLDHSTCPVTEDMIEMNASTSDTAIAVRAQMMYSQRILSEGFHQFTEICLEKRPSNRWSASQMLSHSFLKQCRHTSIFSELQKCGLETSDYSKLRDDSLALCNNLNDLSLNGEKENNNELLWDF